MLNINNVTKRFNDTVALDNLSLNLYSGEILGLIGKNGAGKSTTFKLILNFIEPDSGSIYLDNHKLSKNDLDQIGYMPEERGLYLDMSVKQQVLYFAELHDYDKDKALKGLDYWMRRLEVKGFINYKIKALSKGNQQKIQLMAAFIHQPKLLILDEPFSGLDPINIEILISAVKELQENGTAIIFSSHDMRNVEQLSNKLLLLNNGKTILNDDLIKIKDKFGKTNLYIEGPFKKDDLIDLPNLVKIAKDYSGYHLTFTSKEAAFNALVNLKNKYELSGYRLFNPSMDEIFKMKITKKEGKNA
ncbi:ATP-binding cassette domain-containing protein [Fructilactobacillus ixorae]|uniref:ATP-binding cassette domain-containing protein n=1 Tax=Fructilactobacillus ixorae TaxID=1750535 RepID=A0ABY5C395_9LACO|nr:ATP-binding cassette domain-containing protein [Fructilactobacillus ixorae]USS93259.1 ATP-binding cassette domain-containing protein [Fructilactobacillus ixorae]